MKTQPFLKPDGVARWLLLALLLSSPAFTSHAQLSQPTITSVRVESTNVVVTTRVPAGVRRVTLECRERVGSGTWEPRAVTRTDGTGGLITFRLPRSRQIEVMRVREDASEPLPASFYSGTNSFYAQPSSDPAGVRGPGVALNDAAVPGTPTQDSTREVVESDIWKTRGHTIYFFNQLRGLQLIDITNPDAASVRGTLELPAVGEDLYLLGSQHVVLLARNGCAYDQSQVLIVADTNGPPAIVARLPVTGYLTQSRMVGTALYVASQSYRPVANSTNSTWEWGTLVSSFDLADPKSPVARGTLWYPGYGNVVAATDRLLFVVTQDSDNWWQSVVRSIDITAPDGTMHAYESIRTAGHVSDKFKLNWDGGIFTSVSEDWHWDNGTRLVTKLETFRLPDPRSAGPAGVVRLGSLELGRGERLRATRFDGDLVYVVTFFQIDPLWVVNLSNPSTPRIAGSVDVPGWSTFIQPLGARLVTIGIESNHVAVSLFDVGNPAQPALLSRVRLGQTFSWSEGNSDEKAFSVLPDAGLILVPYSGDTTNGYASRVQLIDLNATTLEFRGVIEHQFAPRRAMLYSNRIVSISSSELLSVDAGDRDHPLVRGTTSLAWPVDRVFVHGDFLLELATSSGWWWRSQGTPVLRVTPANSPDHILSQLSLTDLPILGATARGNRLYIAQGEAGGFDPWLVIDGDGSPSVSNTSKFMLTVVGLDNLPAMQVLGQTQTEIVPLGWSADLQPVWPRSDVLVWVGGGFNFWSGPLMGVAAPAVADAAFMRPWWPFWGGSGGQLIAFDVGNSASPQFASQVNLATDNRWSFSKAYSADGLVYLSHQTSEFFPLLVSPSPTPQGGGAIEAAGDLVPAPSGTWTSRSYLDVLDYSDARHPLVRQPVNIPGTLNGLSHQGSVLYTIGTHLQINAMSDWTEYLDASAYDGVSAHLIDSLALPNAWPRPLLVVETNIFIGRSGYTNGWWVGPFGGGPGTPDVGSHSLETWYLSMTGKFTKSGSAMLAYPASVLANFAALLAAQETDNTIALFDASNGAALRRVGQGQPSGCLSADLLHADGQLGRGLWVPLGAYGVAKIPAGP